MEMEWEKSTHFWVLWWSQAAPGARLLIIVQKSKVGHTMGAKALLASATVETREMVVVRMMRVPVSEVSGEGRRKV